MAQNRLIVVCSASCISAVFVGSLASAANPVPWSQGFETDTAGWNDGGSYGSISRQTGPLTAFEGSAYAVVSGTQGGSAPFTRWGAYSTSFPTGGFNTSVAIYIDPATIAIGDGFDFSSASNSTSNSHVRDYIFHFGKMTDGSVRMGASNNSNYATQMGLDNTNSFEITSAGWYVMQHEFRDVGGALSVNLNLLDAGLSTLWSKTLTNGADGIGAPVGGNRYGWFVFMNGSYAIDDSKLEVIPAPGAAALFAMGGVFAARRRR